MIGVAGRAFPDRITPARMPGGIVVVIYQWRDKAVLAERQLDSVTGLGWLAEADYEATFPDAWVDDTRTARAVVIVGYDGDSGEALAPPTLVTTP